MLLNLLFFGEYPYSHWFLPITVLQAGALGIIFADYKEFVHKYIDILDTGKSLLAIDGTFKRVALGHTVDQEGSIAPHEE